MKAIIALLGISLILLASSQGVPPSSTGTTGCPTGCAYCSIWSTLNNYATCATCSSGYVASTVGTCTSCGTATANSGACTINGTTITVTGCASGYYNSAASGAAVVCTACPTGAATCTSATVHQICSAGYYIVTSGSNSVCTLCMIPSSSSAGVPSSAVTGCNQCNYNGVCLGCYSTGTTQGWIGTTATGTASCVTTASLIPTGCFSGTAAAVCTLCLTSITTFANTYYLASAPTCTVTTTANFISNCLVYNTAGTACTLCITGYMPSTSGTASCTPCTAFAASSPTVASCTQCASGYYGASATCTVCPTGCATCTSATSCQSCSATYYLAQSGLCVSGTLSDSKCLVGNTTSLCVGCVANYALNSTVGCSACPTNCATCSNATTCTACSTGYTINTTTNASCYNASAKSANILVPAFTLLSAIFYFLF